MRTKQLFLILALLCTVVQGAWAQANGIKGSENVIIFSAPLFYIECSVPSEIIS